MLKTFARGGIHPDDNKRWAKDKPIERLPLAPELTIPLSMSIGAPSKPLVAVGDSVKRGQLIAEKGAFVSSNICSPCDGKVKSFGSVTLPSGMSSGTIVIETDNPGSLSDNSAYREKTREEFDALTKKDILSIIDASGIVGMGGATFSAGVKYTVPEGKSVEYFLINACECEPYLDADYRLLVERREDIIKGIETIQKVLEPAHTCFCTEENKKDEALSLRDIAGDVKFDVEVLETKYPQGDEKMIINAVTGRFIPSGKLPLDVGCMVVNLGTMLAVYDAVWRGKPCMERVVTVAGNAIAEPKNLLVTIGTPVQELIDYCGGVRDEDGEVKLISGGVMMGFAFYDTSVPVTKGTSGVLMLREARRPEAYSCISCGRCTESCPIGLLPTLLYKNIMKGNIQFAVGELNLLDCRECGSCDYSCPAGVNLVQSFKLGKKLWREMKK